MRLLLFVLFLILVIEPYESTLLECAKSNRKTCQNIFTAYSCGRLDECISVWLKSPWVEHSKDVSKECAFCKSVASQPWFLQMSDILCDSVKDAIECQSVLKSLSRMQTAPNPEIPLCNALTVCDSHVYIGDLDFSSGICDDCKRIIEDVKKLVADNETTEAIERTMSKIVCDPLPDSIKDYCINVVKAHIVPIIQAVEEHIDPARICSLLGLCSGNTKNMTIANFWVSKNLKNSNSVTPKQCPKETGYSWIRKPAIRRPSASSDKLDVPSCDDCVAVFKQIESVLKNPDVQDEIKKIVDEKVCSNMGFLEPACRKLIEHNFPEIIDALLKVDVKDACHMFGMCSTSKQPCLDMDYSKSVNIPIPGVCQLCEIIVEKVFDLVALNQTEESLLIGMKTFCHALPSRYQSQCLKFVEEYGVKIVEAVIKGTAPRIICAAFGVCTSKPVELVLPKSISKLGDYCTTCKFLVEAIYAQLRDGKTKEELKNLLSEFCEVFPEQYSKECKMVIDQYLDIVLDYFEKSLPPEQVCQLINLCPSKGPSSLSEQNPCLRGPSFWCTNYAAAKRCNALNYCNSVGWVTYPLSFLNPADKSLCESMDPAARCVNFELAERCNRVKECSADRLSRFLKVIVEPASKRTPNCSVCKKIASQWRLQHRFMGGPMITRDICSDYKDEDLEQCYEVIEKHGKIMQELNQGLYEPEQICARTINCEVTYSGPKNDKTINPQSASPNNPPSEQPLDLRCTEGPDYWCTSKRRALACGAVNYCNTYKWSTEKLDKSSNEIPNTGFNEPLIHSNSERLLGLDACTWGPTYWCLSAETAEKCGIDFNEHCRSAPPQPIGKRHPCSRGPFFWCESISNAKLCGKYQYNFCKKFVWTKSTIPL